MVELGLDGPTLRAVRESMGVPLRRVARVCGLSHGHLSKVERGEHGRPITPAVLAAYERATGVSLAAAAADLAERREGVAQGGRWRPGTLTDLRRLGFNAAIGALALGGQLGDPSGRVVEAAGRPVVPAPVRLGDVEQLEAVAAQLTELDLRYGGGLVAEAGKLVLRWATPMLDQVSVAEPVGRRLYAVVATLAGRTAWAAFDVGGHEPARTLYRLAVYTAVRSGDHNLRAHLLADAAAQHNHIGYHNDTLELVRLVEGDERIHPAVRMVLHGVKARACAALGDRAACRRNTSAAERAYQQAQDGAEGWLATLVHPGRLHAATGHALARLAHDSGETADITDACQHLGTAIETLDTSHHARARAFCQARLATLLLTTGDLDQGTHAAREVIAAACLVRSVRLIRALANIGRAAEQHDTPAIKELISDIDITIDTATSTGAATGSGSGSGSGGQR